LARNEKLETTASNSIRCWIQ